MTVTMVPGASSGCTKAYPIASDAPTTSPSHGDTSSVHGESPRPIPEQYRGAHPTPITAQTCYKLFTPDRDRVSSASAGVAKREPGELSGPD